MSFDARLRRRTKKNERNKTPLFLRRIHIEPNYDIIWWALPIAAIYIPIEKIRNNVKWSDKKAIRVLNKILPRHLHYDKEKDVYYYCMDWLALGLRTGAPIYYKNWIYHYHTRLQEFIKDGYEPKGYEKRIDVNEYGDIYIEFKKVVDK